MAKPTVTGGNTNVAAQVKALLALPHVKDLLVKGGASFLNDLADGDHTLVPVIDMKSLESSENSLGNAKKQVTLRFDSKGEPLYVAVSAFTRDYDKAVKVLETYLAGATFTITVKKGRITKYATA